MASITSTAPAPTTVSTASPKTPSFFVGSLMRGGLAEVASTPPPTTPPPPPPPDPFNYEKTMYKDRVGLRDLTRLKEQVRILKGLPLTEDKSQPKIDSTKSPKMRPKQTFTSSKRKELQRHRMFFKCGNLKDQYSTYQSLSSKEEENDKFFRLLRSESMAKSFEQVDEEFDKEELENLHLLAVKAKEHEVSTFKETLASRMRYKFNRGQPIISDNFRNAYDDYNKPPFCNCKHIYRPKIYQLPKIDKSREIWYDPVDDDDGIPLHRQMKSPEPKVKGKRKGERPPLRHFKRDKRTSTLKSSKEDVTKRPPWRSVNYKACSHSQ